MHTIPALLITMATLLPLVDATAATTSFRCKNDLVNVGDGKASALLKCGPPLVKDAFCKPVQPELALVPTGRPLIATVSVAAAVCETVDEWTYNPGYGQFMTTLRFESGRLVQISYGDRVK